MIINSSVYAVPSCRLQSLFINATEKHEAAFDTRVERRLMLLGRIDEQRLITLARNLGRHAGEEVVNERARSSISHGPGVADTHQGADVPGDEKGARPVEGIAIPSTGRAPFSSPGTSAPWPIPSRQEGTA